MDEVQKLRLKTQALLERVTQTESQNADYRVEITALGQEVQELRRENEALRAEGDKVDVPEEVETTNED